MSEQEKAIQFLKFMVSNHVTGNESVFVNAHSAIKILEEAAKKKEEAKPE